MPQFHGDVTDQIINAEFILKHVNHTMFKIIRYRIGSVAWHKEFILLV